MNMVLVTKKDGSTRTVTNEDSFPLIRIDDTSDVLSGFEWFPTLDLKRGLIQRVNRIFCSKCPIPV